MASFRILDQFPVYLNTLGVRASGGTLQFFDSGTTTPKDVFGDEGLTINNGPVILLGTDGRAVDDIWGNGNYRVRLYDVNNTLIAEADDVEIPGGGGTAIPSLVPGDFLTNDGANLLWQPILQVADPTGQSGKILGTDGTSIFWQSTSALNIPTITPVTGGVSAGGFMWLQGSGSVPASGTTNASAVVTFPTAFTSAPFAIAVAGAQCQPGGPAVCANDAASTTGVTFVFDIAEGNSGQANFVNATPYTWFAFGPK